MTEDKKDKIKHKPIKQYALEAQQRLRNSHKPQQQKFNKPNNFRPQGRGR